MNLIDWLLLLLPLWKVWTQQSFQIKSRFILIFRVNVVLNSTVVVDGDYNNSPIQDYVHPDDQNKPTFYCYYYYYNNNSNNNNDNNNNNNYYYYYYYYL